MTMETKNFEIIFSELASEKLESLSIEYQERINELVKKISSSLEQVISSKDVHKLFDNLYSLRVDIDKRIIFSIEEDSIFITDISPYSDIEGPLPDPKTLEYYEKINPGATEKILKLAEQQMKHRVELEKIMLLNEVRYKRVGQLFAMFIILIGILISSYLLIFTDKDIIAIVVFLTTTIPILFGVITRKKEKKRNRNSAQ